MTTSNSDVAPKNPAPARGEPRIERKVSAATGGALLGTVLANALTYALDRWIVTPGDLGGLPGELTSAVELLGATLGAFVLGYLTKHTWRRGNGSGTHGGDRTAG